MRRCRTILQSYRDSVVRCCREAGHKGEHRMDEAGKREANRALAEFMQRSVSRSVPRLVSNQERKP